jgi:hypothetical protein
VKKLDFLPRNSSADKGDNHLPILKQAIGKKIPFLPEVIITSNKFGVMLHISRH